MEEENINNGRSSLNKLLIGCGILAIGSTVYFLSRKFGKNLNIFPEFLSIENLMVKIRFYQVQNI
jgi:hypothetical protein